MLKKAIIILTFLAIASVLAHLYVKSQVYYPVVRLIIPGGVSIAAVLRETKERKACGIANERFLTPVKQQCKECKIVVAQCQRELAGLELALQQREPLPYPMVVDREARVAFMGPPDLAKIGCDAAAASMVARGVKSAVCIPAHKDAPPRS